MDDSRICLDTGVLIAYLKGRGTSVGAVERAVKHFYCCVTAITAYELLFGVAHAKKHIGEDALLGAMRILPFDEAAARRAAVLHDQLIRANDDIGIKDVLIAAISLEQGLPLLTLNERHFLRVPGLRVLTPEAFLTL